MGQTALKLLAGCDEELLQIIPILLGCNKEDIVEGNLIKSNLVQDIAHLMKETAFSHLMEVSHLLLSSALNVFVQVPILHLKIAMFVHLLMICFKHVCM